MDPAGIRDDISIPLISHIIFLVFLQNALENRGTTAA